MSRSKEIERLSNEVSKAHKEVIAARRALSDAKYARDVIQRALDMARFNCRCARLNRDIGVYDTFQQAELDRIGLSIGVVADTFSAEQDCPICHGTGEANGE